MGNFQIKKTGNFKKKLTKEEENLNEIGKESEFFLKDFRNKVVN